MRSSQYQALKQSEDIELASQEEKKEEQSEKIPFITFPKALDELILSYETPHNLSRHCEAKQLDGYTFESSLQVTASNALRRSENPWANMINSLVDFIGVALPDRLDKTAFNNIMAIEDNRKKIIKTLREITADKAILRNVTHSDKQWDSWDDSMRRARELAYIYFQYNPIEAGHTLLAIIKQAETELNFSQTDDRAYEAKFCFVVYCLAHEYYAHFQSQNFLSRSETNPLYVALTLPKIIEDAKIALLRAIITALPVSELSPTTMYIEEWDHQLVLFKASDGMLGVPDEYSFGALNYLKTQIRQCESIQDYGILLKKIALKNSREFFCAYDPNLQLKNYINQQLNFKIYQLLSKSNATSLKECWHRFEKLDESLDFNSHAELISAIKPLSVEIVELQRKILLFILTSDLSYDEKTQQYQIAAEHKLFNNRNVWLAANKHSHLAELKKCVALHIDNMKNSTAREKNKVINGKITKLAAADNRDLTELHLAACYDLYEHLMLVSPTNADEYQFLVLALQQLAMRVAIHQHVDYKKIASILSHDLFAEAHHVRGVSRTYKIVLENRLQAMLAYDDIPVESLNQTTVFAENHSYQTIEIIDDAHVEQERRAIIQQLQHETRMDESIQIYAGTSYTPDDDSLALCSTNTAAIGCCIATIGAAIGFATVASCFSCGSLSACCCNPQCGTVPFIASLAPFDATHGFCTTTVNCWATPDCCTGTAWNAFCIQSWTQAALFAAPGAAISALGGMCYTAGAAYHSGTSHYYARQNRSGYSPDLFAENAPAPAEEKMEEKMEEKERPADEYYQDVLIPWTAQEMQRHFQSPFDSLYDATEVDASSAALALAVESVDDQEEKESAGIEFSYNPLPLSFEATQDLQALTVATALPMALGVENTLSPAAVHALRASSQADVKQDAVELLADNSSVAAAATTSPLLSAATTVVSSEHGALDKKRDIANKRYQFFTGQQHQSVASSEVATVVSNQCGRN